MWNRARPAPEYQLGWYDKRAARDSLERILAWDIDRIVIAHGDWLEEHAKQRLGHRRFRLRFGWGPE